MSPLRRRPEIIPNQFNASSRSERQHKAPGVSRGANPNDPRARVCGRQILTPGLPLAYASSSFDTESPPAHAGGFMLSLATRAGIELVGYHFGSAGVAETRHPSGLRMLLYCTRAGLVSRRLTWAGTSHPSGLRMMLSRSVKGEMARLGGDKSPSRTVDFAQVEIRGSLPS